MVTEAERHAFMRDVLGMTQAEIDEYDTEMVVDWLTVGLPREAAAVGMEPLAYQRMLNDIVDLAEARNAQG